MQNTDDEILMQLYAQGDVQAFSTLYSRHKNSLYRYFLRQVATRELAEELYQEVWNKLIKARERYQVKSKFSTWLYRIARNELIDFYRRESTESKVISFNFEQADEVPTRKTQTEILVDQSKGLFQKLEDAEQALQLKECLQQLPRQQKEVFLLKHESGFSLKEIAQLVGETTENVKSRLRYSLAKLKHCLTFKMRQANE